MCCASHPLLAVTDFALRRRRWSHRPAEPGVGWLAEAVERKGIVPGFSSFKASLSGERRTDASTSSGCAVSGRVDAVDVVHPASVTAAPPAICDRLTAMTW
jgi:hypothetical protein